MVHTFEYSRMSNFLKRSTRDIAQSVVKKERFSVTNTNRASKPNTLFFLIFFITVSKFNAVPKQSQKKLD